MDFIAYLLEGSILVIFIKLFLVASIFGLFRKVFFNKHFIIFVLFLIVVYYALPQTDAFINQIGVYVVNGFVSVFQLLFNLVNDILQKLIT